jgi:hypothetical protein
MDTLCQNPPRPDSTNTFSSNGRDHKGRFARGNAGGPGNPFARQVGRLRKALLDCLTEEAMVEIGRKLIELAREGDVQAIRLLFSYTLGKPAEAVSPDRLDLDEWECLGQAAQIQRELPGMMTIPDPELPLEMVRAVRPAVARDMARMMHEVSKEQENPAVREAESLEAYAERFAAAVQAGTLELPPVPAEALELPIPPEEELPVPVNEGLRAEVTDEQVRGGPPAPPVASLVQQKQRSRPPSTNGETTDSGRQLASARTAQEIRPTRDTEPRITRITPIDGKRTENGMRNAE